MNLKTADTPHGLAYYTTDQAEGAISNGTKVVKVRSEKGDTNPVGTTGVVIGSMGGQLHGKPIIGYFVFWDHAPGVPVFVADFKIERQQKGATNG
jgi:hypothetical protein